MVQIRNENADLSECHRHALDPDDHADYGTVMNEPRFLALVGLGALLTSGCASRRFLAVENHVLQQRNDELEARLADLESRVPNPEAYVHDVDLKAVDALLEHAGYVHSWNQTGQGHIRVEYTGHNADFALTIQHFPTSKVLFLATSNLFHLDEAQSTESVVLLLASLATLNYELLIGKFQLNPETGEILLSTELEVADGVGVQTLVGAIDQLLETADAHYPELEHAAAGIGL